MNLSSRSYSCLALIRQLYKLILRSSIIHSPLIGTLWSDLWINQFGIGFFTEFLQCIFFSSFSAFLLTKRCISLACEWFFYVIFFSKQIFIYYLSILNVWGLVQANLALKNIVSLSVFLWFLYNNCLCN